MQRVNLWASVFLTDSELDTDKKGAFIFKDQFSVIAMAADASEQVE